MSRIWILISFLIAAQAGAGEKAAWSVEIMLGDAYNFDSRTRIEHGQHERFSLQGEYDTRGFQSPLHYAWRVARWQEDRAWELQLLHHKLYLRNRPPGINALSVSHGFNIVTLNRAIEADGWRFRFGAGPVIAHPEAQIAATSYDGPYELAGAAAVAGVGRRIAVGSRLYLLGELTATFGYIEAHPDGAPELRFSVRNPALHAQLGLGYRF